jgi:hypothetical protein
LCKLVYLDRAKKDFAAIIDFIELATGDVETGYAIAERIKTRWANWSPDK